MTFEFFKFELREQLRSPLLWVLAALFALLAFGAASSDAVQIGGGIGNVHRNAPTVIAQWLTFFTLVGMLIITIFITSALLRDFDQGTAELFFASPIRKRDYLAGRLAAAFTASLVVYMVIALGIFIAQFMPWIDPARLGPISLQPYLWTFAVQVIPNVLFTGALLALLAATTRSILWVYIGVLAFYVLYGTSAYMLKDLDNVWLATLAEPLGVRALSRTLRYWSVEERNAGLPAVAGYLLANRALWSVIALAMLAATFALFKTERSGTSRRRGKRKAVSAPAPASRSAERSASVVVPKPTPAFTAATAWQQFLRQVRFDTAGVLRSVPFLVMLVFGIANFIPSALFMSTTYETPIHPVTSQILDALQASYGFLLVIIVLFYAGELVWKERGTKINEVSDAMPVPNWVPLLAKFTTLVAVIVCFQAIGALTAVAIQLAKGHTQLEPLVYLKLLSVNCIAFILMGGMALVLQVLSNNKFIGYALLLVVVIAQAALGMMDFDHMLYTFGRWPNAPYSDMNGYGHFLPGQLWFQMYWALCLLCLLLVSLALWVRGVDQGRKQRFAIARQRMRGPLARGLIVAVLAFVAVGGWLFWNTNIRNTYLSGEQQLDLQARYEREYGKYRNLAQPRILATQTEIDLRPETQTLRVHGRYRVRNPHAQAIPEIHISVPVDDALTSIDLGGAKLVKHDKPLGYRIYRLDRPMQPGEMREVAFEMDYHPNGLTNSAPETRIVDNGSFFNNRIFPTFGYDAGGEITDRNDRRKRKLGEPRRMPKLEDTQARANPYIDDDADWLDFKTTICTAPDQIALAPGYLQKEFTRAGRRCFSYAMDRPMLNFYAYLSARWQVKKGDYVSHLPDGSTRRIPIEIYYDAHHPYNIDRMIEASRKSLAYYEANFTPYQHRQVRIIEFPGYVGTFAQSFANTIPYSEAIGFIADLRDKDNIDYVYYVTAHEVAHQWWAHQVIGGNVQGATMLSESLAQYSALMVMEKEYGRDKMRQFLKTELDGYLSGRGGERVEELPLYRNENQQYIHYQKGSLVFYRLREELGEAAVNRALKKFLQDKGFQQAPYTTSAELLTYLRAEAKPEQQALITDLFEKISFYDNRVETATAKKRADGKYEVTLELHADKRYADGKGKETAGKLDDWIEVGVFGQGKTGEEADRPVLYMERVHVTSAKPKLTVVVDQLPYEAGFDPYNKLIDRVSADNRKRVSM
ncbi:ABC transporter permease/M1 family aminopeptidase [Agrilutibacter solisilvae]|uniref:ABC transporter permease subunit n=1 Tax=Agrilutibacter solisilvae TaxID=2763317 RepID=A0A974Y000_9GAMM|nr:M1 family aminopeptidase [Lysobacter solisilvae]QSX77940.1 ABC transporter permease subunit [Lysobacter solisilvae]